jgi:flagellin
MALGVLNNLSAIYAENNLNNTNNSLQTVLEQLSSGSKINSGADDAAGLSLVNGLAANSAALTQSETNATEGVGLLQVADGALSQVTSLLDRAITLATEAANGTLNSTQESAANQEYQSILSEINNIGQTTTYNQEQVFNGNTIAIYTGDSSTAGSSVDELNIRTLSESSVGDTGGKMAYSDGADNVFLNLSSSTIKAKATDTLNSSGTTSINVNYLVKGANGSNSTATTSITVGTGTSYANTANGLISAINNSGLGLTASFTTQSAAGVTGGGSQTGIEITGGLVSAGVDPSTSSTSGELNASGVAAGELLTQGQTVTVKVGSTTAAAITISSTVSTLSQLASAINTASANGGTNSPSTLVTASVITNSDGSQSLTLSDSSSSGAALSVATTAGASITQAFANAGTGSTASNNEALSSINTTNATGTAAVTAVDGSLTVGVGSVTTDSSLTGTYVVTNAPASGSAVSETFVMGGTGGTDAGNTGTLSGTTFTVNGNSLANLEAAIAGQNATGSGRLGLGVTVAAGANGTTAFTLTGSSGHTVSSSATGLTYTNTLTGSTPALTTAAGTTTNIATLSVAQNNAGTDTLNGSIVLQNGGGTAETFVMGSGSDNATNGVVGGVAPNTYYTNNQTLTAGEITAGDSKNSLAGLKDLINGKLGASVTATVSTAGLTVTSNTAGTNVTSSTNTLVNSDTAVQFYLPDLTSQAGEYSTALLAATNSAGTSIAGAISSSDNLTGSIVLTNAGVSDTFVMGTNPANGTTGVTGAVSLTGGNTYYAGNGGTSVLTTAINNLVGSETGGAGLNLTASAGASGGIYLQATTATATVISETGTLAVANAATATSSVNGVTAAAGTASTVTVAPGSGTVNTTDTLTGSVVLTNTPTTGSAVTETFKMGTSANDGTTSKGSLSGTTFTVNGNTLADLQAAINSQTTTGTGSLGLGLTALASTNGLSVSSSTNNGSTVGATSTLVDTTQGTYSSISMGSYASQSDTVSGDFTIKVGSAAAETVNLTSGETVSAMIAQINGTTTTNGVTTSTNPYGVTASWVAPSGTDNYGSIQLTSNTAGSSGNITAASESITDTPTSATLSYTANSASNMSLSGTITDSTTKQTSAATFSTDSKSSSGTATISYTDAAGQSLSGTDLSNQSDAENALTALNAAITDVAAQDGYIGAQINTLNSVSQVLTTQQENVQSAQNAVQATDYASATSNMSKYEILSQTGIAALAQANSIQQEVTKLLQ